MEKNIVLFIESIYLTIFGWLSSFNNEISLIAVLGIPSSSLESFIFFKAKISFVSLSYKINIFL
jgi:hypothetical protein